MTAPIRQQHTFREVYLAHFDYVWSTLRRLGVREQDAQDWAQKVFLSAYMKLGSFEERASLRSWLFRSCINAAGDYRRAAPIRRELATEPAAIEAFSRSAEQGQEEEEEEEARKRLSAAEAVLDKLPEHQRLVFILFELEEMSGAEIAELLEISVGTVRSRLRLAREHFLREVKRLSVQQLAWRKQAF